MGGVGVWFQKVQACLVYLHQGLCPNARSVQLQSLFADLKPRLQLRAGNRNGGKAKN